MPPPSLNIPSELPRTANLASHQPYQTIERGSFEKQRDLLQAHKESLKMSNTLNVGYPGDQISPRTKKARDRVESKVELFEIQTSNYGAQYEPTEKIRTVIVPSFPDLGRLSAWRFIEWVQASPEGVCSLPTGRTPEFFIKFVGKNSTISRIAIISISSLAFATFLAAFRRRLVFSGRDVTIADTIAPVRRHLQARQQLRTHSDKGAV